MGTGATADALVMGIVAKDYSGVICMSITSSTWLNYIFWYHNISGIPWYSDHVIPEIHECIYMYFQNFMV